MVKATVVDDAAAVDAGAHRGKPTSTTSGQTEANLRVWEAPGLRAGIWEVTPGTFSSTREGYHEICQILSGSATITESDGTSFDVGPGSLFITPAGWSGDWVVHEFLRKTWVVQETP